MASAWGSSWGASWGNSWGLISPPDILYTVNGIRVSSTLFENRIYTVSTVVRLSDVTFEGRVQSILMAPRYSDVSQDVRATPISLSNRMSDVPCSTRFVLVEKSDFILVAKEQPHNNVSSEGNIQNVNR